MKHPALTRVTAVTLAVFCLVTLLAGGGVIWKARGDHQEDLRRRQLLRDRTDRAAALLARLDELSAGYRTAFDGLEEASAAHDAKSSDYRSRLGVFTATRAGVVMGRESLEQASDLLWYGKKKFDDGYEQYRQGAEIFEELYQIYSTASGGISAGREVYARGLALLESGGSDAPDLALSPEEALAAITLTRAGIDLLETVVRSAAEPSGDESAAAESMRRLRALAEQASEQMVDVDPQALAARAVRETLARADALIERRVEAGASEEEALAEADVLCRAALGMSYAEAKSFRQEMSAPHNSGGGAFSALLQMDPEQFSQLLSAFGGEGDLPEQTLAVLEEEKRALDEQEAALRADPEAMSSSEALLTLLKTELDSADRIFALVSGAMDGAKEQMEVLAVQMEQARAALEEGIRTIALNRLKLSQTAEELEAQREQMRREKLQLASESAKLLVRQEIVDEYRAAEKEFRSARAALMSYDGVAAPVHEGADLLESAEAELTRLTESQERDYKGRLSVAAAMLAACLPAVLCTAGAFEHPKMKRLWLPAVLCALTAAAGEAASVRLGRGLWYSALFLALTALCLVPLTAGERRKGQTAEGGKREL